MSKLSCFCWSISLLLLVLPWLVATMLGWIFAQVFEEVLAEKGEEIPEDEPRIGWISAIMQTASVVVYISYVLSVISCVGLLTRHHMCSFCCLIVGIPVFTVVPLVTGGGILVTTLTAEDGSLPPVDSGAAHNAINVGVATGTFCLLSTLPCLFILFWAVCCGSRDCGKKHVYPMPLCYFPFLRDFKEIHERGIDSQSKYYTSDYPPPLESFGERHKVNVSALV